MAHSSARRECAEPSTPTIIPGIFFTFSCALTVATLGLPGPGRQGRPWPSAGTFGMSGCELSPFPAGGALGDAEAMNTRFSQVSHTESAGGLLSPAAQAAPGPLDQACCCVARAVVRVVMPSTLGRPHETELLLCGHHYRVSRAAMAAAHARVKELADGAADDTAWFHDDRTRMYAMVARG
jgi:hypothetical protein